MKTQRIAKISVLLAVAGLMMAPAAKASYEFDLGAGNTGLVGYSGPFAHVSVDLTSSTTATITFTSLISPDNNYIYLMGDGGTVGVNVNGGYTLGSVSELNSGTGFTPSYKNNTPGNEDGFGYFNLSLNNNDGYKDTATKITFDITKTSGIWASANDVLTKNANGAWAAAHIFVAYNPADATTETNALTTGYAAVPEAGTVLAGVLLLLPFGASMLRIFRKNRMT